MCTGTIAFVRGVIAFATSSGTIVQVSGSMSTRTGVAPVPRIAPTVAKKVCETVTTSSLGPTPSAFSASSSAVVPLDTATHSPASQARANSCSNAAVSGPLMKSCRSRTRAIAAWISPSIERYWALRSTSGSSGTCRLVGGRAPPAVGARDRSCLQDLDHFGSLLEVRARLVAREDALDEVPALGLERLDVRQARHVHVAHALNQPELPEARELAERTAQMLAVDAGVVDRDLVCHVVVDDHLAAPDDRHPTHLARAEPAHLDVRDREVVLEHHERQVRDPGLQIVVSVAVHRDRAGVEPVLDDRDVVRREVPDRIDVAANATEVEPLRVDVVDLPELALPQQLAHVLHGRAEAEGVPHHQDEAGRAGLLAESAAVGRRERERLLDEDMLAGLERLGGQLH